MKTADEMFRELGYRPVKDYAGTIAYCRESKSYDDETERLMIVVFPDVDVVRKTLFVDGERIGNSPWHKGEIRAVDKLLDEIEAEVN